MLSKTHSVLGEKIASAPKVRQTQTLFLSVSIVVLLAIVWFAPAYATVPLWAGSREFTLQVADDAGARDTGLSGRSSSLASNAGMLFSYPSSGIRCFWMKGMHFSLDIIWLNAGKQVTYIQPNASPSSYPRQFCPHVPAKYVIELSAGAVRTSGVRDGQALRF